jgi:L-Ala-D/L-Glu epimerase
MFDQAEMSGMEVLVESSAGSAAWFHVAFANKVITSVELTGPFKFSKDVGNLWYDVPYIRLTEKPGPGVEINEMILDELTVFRDVVR